MKFSNLQLRRPLVCLVAGLFLSTVALAEKPEGAGGGNSGHGNGNGNSNSNSNSNGNGNGNSNGKRDRADNSEQNMRQGRVLQNSGGDQTERRGEAGTERKGQKARAAGPVNVGSYFADNQRTAVRTYYGNQYSAGRCPPGLAKKNNGCMPPGQARKWAVGQQLPRDVVYYSVPQSVVSQLGAAPPSYKYLRVAADILLIAIGTNLVVDAIQDLGRL